MKKYTSIGISFKLYSKKYNETKQSVIAISNKFSLKIPQCNFTNCSKTPFKHFIMLIRNKIKRNNKTIIINLY